MVILGGGAVAYERGTPVQPESKKEEGGRGAYPGMFGGDCVEEEKKGSGSRV